MSAPNEYYTGASLIRYMLAVINSSSNAYRFHYIFTLD